MNISRRIISKKCLFEHAIYVKSRKEDTLIVILHVDDIIFMKNSLRIMEEFKGAMLKKFEMINLGLMKYVLVFR
jgi:Reverse transcriptase (RNA-dependent DNA polymerase)